MRRARIVCWACALFAVASSDIMAGEVRVCVQGSLTDTTGQPALEGSYPVVVRLRNGRGVYDPVVWTESTYVNNLKGQFRLLLGPHVSLTRKGFNGDQSVSFQFQGEPELRRRAILEHMAPSGRVNCAPIPLATASLPSTSPGTRVRLHQEGNGSAVGTLLSMTTERVELLGSAVARTPLQIPFDSIARFEISVQHRRHGQLGALVGCAVGGLVGYAVGANEEDDLVYSKETKRAFDTFAGAILGALGGLIVGNSITTDRWQELPLDRLQERARDEFGPIVQAR